LEANCPGAGLVRVIFLLRRKAYQCVGEKSLYCCSLLLGLPSSLIGIASYRPVRRIVKVHGCRSSTATEECIRKSAFCVHLPGAIHRTSQTEPVYVLIFFSFFLHNGSARYGLICPDERGNEILVAVWQPADSMLCSSWKWIICISALYLQCYEFVSLSTI
jgi:hypothetical protein